MKTLIALALFLATLTIAGAPPLRAQEAAFVQIEAVRTLSLAQERARAFASALPNVNGFRAPGGWYVIALGPYTPAAAEADRQALRQVGLIPNDSYLTDGAQYRQQFWPVGANALAMAPAGTPIASSVSPTALPQAEASLTPPLAAPAAPDAQPEPAATPKVETPREARAAELLLSAEERRTLQEALKWQGFYDGAIDGAFGPGTRTAMAAWQAANGFEPTGILTSAQRAALVDAYTADRASLGLEQVIDEEAGIAIELPLGKVARSGAEAPFVHYDSTDEEGVGVLLISQSGTRETLYGLFDVMQTLEIVPLTGHREKQTDSFVLMGQNERLHSYTYARLADGAVKGFTLVWPPGDTRRMDKVVTLMRESFRPIPGMVLPDTATSGDGTDQAVDLLAGLEIRRPEVSRSGFFVGEDGLVLTTTDVLRDCARLTLGDESLVTLRAEDRALGLALLAPAEVLRPIRVAAFRTSPPRLRSDLVLAGFSYEDALDLPTMTWGTLEDLRGLDGEDHLERLSISPLPGDTGGPVLDQTGAVAGMLTAPPEDGRRQLPPDVAFAVDASAIAGFLAEAGVTVQTASSVATLAPEDITSAASDMTVLVSCWK